MTVGEVLDAGKRVFDLNYIAQREWANKYRIGEDGICDNYENMLRNNYETR